MKFIVSIFKGLAGLIEAACSESKGKHVAGKVAGRGVSRKLKRFGF